MNNSIVRATPAARHLAKEKDIELDKIKGTGAKGRVHLIDVEEYKNGNMIHISPLARKIAEANNIELSLVAGTGVRGKIMKDDVLKLIKSFDKANKILGTDKEVVNTLVKKEETKTDSRDEIVPMTAMRKVISKRMSESYFTAPTFALNYDVDMTELIALRKKLIDSIMDKTGNKVTITDLIAMAVSKVLTKHPYVNASISEDGNSIIFHNYVNLGIAVGFDGGLLVPVINDTDKLSLSELVVKSKEVITKALSMKLSPAEMAGSTFTISNLGMFGVSSFNPIINQPNSAILGISSTVEKPVVVNKEIVVRPIMTITLTLDHRVVDGLAGAKFMQDLKSLIENPISMLI